MSRNRSNGTRSRASQAFIKARASFEQFPEAKSSGWRESVLGKGNSVYDAIARQATPIMIDGHLSSRTIGPNPFAARPEPRKAKTYKRWANQ